MKSNKALLLLSVIVAVLVLGIAYAAVSANFTVNGTASAAPNADNFKVAFVPVTETTTTQGNAVIKYSATEKTADFTVTGLSTANDTATISYTIKNSSTDIDALLAGVNVNNTNTEYFEVTATELTDARVKAGAQTVLTITVKLKKNVAIDVNTKVTVTFTATSVEPL